MERNGFGLALWAALFAALAAGCSGADESGVSSVGPLAADVVEWKDAKVDVGVVSAVADLANAVVVLSDTGAHVLVGGVEVARDASQTSWRGAARVTTAYEGETVLAVGGDGRVYALHELSALEDVSDRYGLGGDDVKSIAFAGGSTLALGLDAEIAVADGMTVTRYAIGGLGALTGGSGRVAGIDAAGDVVVFDPVTAGKAAYQALLPTGVAFDAGGRLIVAQRSGVLAEDVASGLAPVVSGAAVHGLAASGARVWFADGGELGVIASGAVKKSSGLTLAPDVELFASVTGDVWALSGGELARYSVADEPPDEKLWSTTVQPVATKVCLGCHLPKGTAGVDLSTYEGWAARRAAVADRVGVKKSMPPAGYPFTESDRAAILAWASGGAGE